MYQIDNASAAAAQPASTAPGAAGFFTDGNPAGNVPATIVPAEWLNALMMELSNAVTGTGQVLNKSAFNQLLTAIQTVSKNPGSSPVRFDRSTLSATTQWVTAFGKQYSGAYNYGGAVTGVVGHVGGLMFFGGGGPNSYAMPAITANSIPVGATLTITNVVSVPTTVVPNGTDRIQMQNGVIVASFAQPGGTTVEYCFTGNNAGVNYWTATGTGVLSNSADFAGSLASAGYQKLPGGLVLQWATVSTNTVGQFGWSFPLAMPHGYFMSAGFYVNGSITPQGSAVTVAETAVPGATLTGATFICSAAGVGLNTAQLRMFAMGF
jgi:hypothetical protein